MIETTAVITTASGERTVSLASFLEADAEEAAHTRAYHWIKELRHARVDGRAFRQRFTVRGDSLWWFTELYLHKEQAIVDIYRTLAAVRALIERERPSAIGVEGPPLVRRVVHALAARAGISTSATDSASEWEVRLRGLRRRAMRRTFEAWASRLRRGTPPRQPSPLVAAFIHRAFFHAAGVDGGAESYIGPTLQALEQRAGRSAVRYVGVGPPVNFRARQSRTARNGESPLVVPVERYAPWGSLRDSRLVWRARVEHLAAVTGSTDLRDAAMFDDVDCWPIVREQLAGVVYLQWPWSARVMDEAAAALDSMRPSSVVTYAEAGGWGRALILEARRRGIPSAGLQHGFIYHRWLNYLHEPDEMSAGGRGDPGFPAPTVTALFDDYAAAHLRVSGHYPPASLKVTGSPRLDALMAALARVGPADISSARQMAQVKDGEQLVLVATKEKEARGVLPVLVEAAGGVEGMRLVIKAHPAETREAYTSVAGRRFVTVLPADAPLAPLLAAARAVVTVNSTVALDAGVAGVPALVIGLPNNLSPFVDKGAMAGATGAAEIGAQLQRLLYDEGFRKQLSGARAEVLGAHAMTSDGGAAARTADTILQLTR
jgi:hypothetical protein